MSVCKCETCREINGDETDEYYQVDHAALAAAHWDGYTGPLVEAAITAGGESPSPATLALLRYVAISHWIHGAKHERENH